jgi:hypothetical protein
MISAQFEACRQTGTKGVGVGQHMSDAVQFIRSGNGFRLSYYPEIIGWDGAHLKAREFRSELARAGFPG